METNNKKEIQSLNPYVKRAITSVQASSQWLNESTTASTAYAAPLQRCSTTDLLRPILPFSQVLVSFELCKLRLSTMPPGAEHIKGAPQLKAEDLADKPLILSSHALPQVYDYAIQRREQEQELDSGSPRLTFLLLYRTPAGKVSFLELLPPVYTLVLALRMASDKRCALGVTECLFAIAEFWQIENLDEFIAQGLEVISQLNDMGLLSSDTSNFAGEYYG